MVWWKYHLLKLHMRIDADERRSVAILTQKESCSAYQSEGNLWIRDSTIRRKKASKGKIEIDGEDLTYTRLWEDNFQGEYHGSKKNHLQVVCMKKLSLNIDNWYGVGKILTLYVNLNKIQPKCWKALLLKDRVSVSINILMRSTLI